MGKVGEEEMTEHEKRAMIIGGLKETLEQEDLIYQDDEKAIQAAIAILETYDVMEALKPQEEQRPHAHWEYKDHHRRSFKQYTGFDAIGEIHTITVREESEGQEPYCSNCGAQAAESFMDYCPRCGAVMDEDITDAVKALGIVEDILDDLINVGNGTTNQMLHADANKLFALRYFLTAVFRPEELQEECSRADKKHWEAIS